MAPEFRQGRRTSFHDDNTISPIMSDAESEHELTGTERLLVGEDEFEQAEHSVLIPPPIPLTSSERRKAFFIRSLALLCACSLSVGSHYASYILGPLKSRLSRELGTSNTDFGLLIAAFSLNSTWTPLVGGVLASTLGTTYTSILATGVIFIGVCLLLIGDILENVRLMVFGLFIFGLGVSPLSVVQETIIVRFFKSHGLGVSMAFGLIAGKGASFVSARTSYPLSQRFGPRAPFYVAVGLTGLSVVINLVYIIFSKWLVDGAGAELEAHDISHEARKMLGTNVTEAQALEKVAAKRKVHFRQITKLGDVFWAYVGVNVLFGTIWTPFTHLAANIIENRYGMLEETAANDASYLLAGSVILYPICGFIVDRSKNRPIITQLMMLSSFLTTLAYAWFALPPSWTKSPMPAIISFATGQGYAPLLYVVLVPRIVPSKYVSTALGVHKSLEQTGSVLFQTFAGLALDVEHKGHKPSVRAVQSLLNVFLLLSISHFCSIQGLAYLQRRSNLAILTRPRSESVIEEPDFRRRSSSINSIYAVPTASNAIGAESPLLEHSERRLWRSLTGSGIQVEQKEHRRGEIFASLCAMLIFSAWALFMITAWFKLGQDK